MRAYEERKSDAAMVSEVWNERRSREETHSDEWLDFLYRGRHLLWKPSLLSARVKVWCLSAFLGPLASSAYDFQEQFIKSGFSTLHGASPPGSVIWFVLKSNHIRCSCGVIIPLSKLLSLAAESIWGYSEHIYLKNSFQFIVLFKGHHKCRQILIHRHPSIYTRGGLYDQNLVSQSK